MANPTELQIWDQDRLGIGFAIWPWTGGAKILFDDGVDHIEWIRSFVSVRSDLLPTIADEAVHALPGLHLLDQLSRTAIQRRAGALRRS